ncbi:MAG: AMP-binding protein, partial [Blastocatellia bacterium]
EIIRMEGWEEPESSIVAIQPKGTKPPFFCIHAKGGNVLFYKDLAKHLGEDQPFYGIQARRVGGRQVGHATVEEMAEFYIREMKEIQPEGPYYLGGSSFGGYAAFEMAAQLRNQGEEVALLALLDTGAPGYPKKLPGTTKILSKFFYYLRRYQHHRDTIFLLRSGERLAYVKEKANKVWNKYSRRIQNARKSFTRAIYTNLNRPIPKSLIQLEDQIERAGKQYSGRMYQGKVTIFRALKQPFGIYPDQTLGWDKFVSGDMEIHEVPGHHGSIVTEPYVRVLAAKLGESIDTRALSETNQKTASALSSTVDRSEPKHTDQEQVSFFNCVLAGSGTLPIRCGELLIKNGHAICGVATSDPELKRWAEQNEIPYFVPDRDLSEQLKGITFDYLFSIVNQHILTEDTLRLPKKLAINYHDAPLPFYAGTHATSWAIINGERKHGISWHLMSDVVDAGDILKQRSVEISENDTALTLNTKCYEAAVSAFEELVDDLSRGTPVIEKQNLENRTFFARYKRPANACLISWDNPASRISSLVRALDFGSHSNPLGRAKLAIGSDFFIISSVEISNTQSSTRPGTVTEIGADFLRISTADQEVIVSGILSLDGRKIAINDLVLNYSLAEGFEFENPDQKLTRRLDPLYNKTTEKEAFWVRKLSEMEPAVPPFWKDGSRLENSQFVSLDIGLPDEFEEFVKGKSNCRKSDLLLTAFAAFWARLTANDSFDIGYSSFEIDEEIKGLENLFSRQVPLRVKTDGFITFADLSESVKAETDMVTANHTFSRDIVVRHPQLKALAYSQEKLSFPIVFSKVSSLDESVSNENSGLTLLASDAGSSCRWIYDEQKIDRDGIERLAGNFSTFIKNIAQYPDQSLANVSLLDDAEKKQLLVAWNDTKIDFPTDRCINQLFEEQVERSPDSVAVIFGDQRLTYRELNQRANQVAHHLRSLGIGAESLVGICVERSVEMIVGILGILKAGGAYVPLDPEYPKERLAYKLKDSRAEVLITKSSLVEVFVDQTATVVYLDKDAELISAEPVINPEPLSSAKNLAYVIYTSGSTGKPKGVAIEHRNAVAFVSWALSVFTPDQLKGVLLSTSICFDLSVYEMFVPLSSGGKIILVENILHLPAAPASNEVTLINTVPSAIKELLRVKGVPPSDRTVNQAGEPLKTSLVKKIYDTGSVK